MKQGKGITISVYRILSYILAVLSIFCSSCMWKFLVGWRIPSSLFRIGLLLTGILMIVLYARFSRKEIQLILLVSLYLLIYIGATRTDIQGYMLTVFSSFLVLIMLSVTSLKGGKLGVLITAYENVIFVIALISLACWLFGSVLGVLPGKSVIYFNLTNMVAKGYTYGHIFFENPRQSQELLGMTIPRNIGVFLEAPTYASFLVYALVIELLRERRSRVKAGVFVLALLSTISAKSYVFLLEILLIDSVKLHRNAERRRSRRVRGGRIVSLAVIALVVAVGAFYIYKLKSDTSAYSYRVDAVLAGIRTWAEHPLFGSGYGNVDAILSNSDLYRRAASISMGLTTLLGQGGLWLTFFFLFPFFACFKKLMRTKREKIYLMVFIIAMTDLLVSRIMYSAYFEMITALGYCLLAVRSKYYLTDPGIRMAESGAVKEHTGSIPGEY